MTDATNKTGDGGPAFPGPGEQFIDGPQGRFLQSAWGAQGSTGMTMRDWFAGQALAAMISCYHYTPTTDEDGDPQTGATEPNFGGDTGSGPDILASKAYKYADAMLAERAKTTL